MRTVNFKNTLHMSQVTPFADNLNYLKKMCSNKITKQKVIFNDSSDYKF